jgi:hypothetical protein
MANANLVGHFRELPQESSPELPKKPRPRYAPRIRAVRPVLPQATRLIYFDQRRASDLLEHIEASPPGRDMLTGLVEADALSLLGKPNQRAILYQLIDSAVDLEVGEVIDLHQPDVGNRKITWTQLHPDQGVAVRGIVDSAKDVQPSSVRLAVGAISVRVFVERDHFLHLNQSYLTQSPLIVVGKVRSVPRIEVCAAAIGTVSTSNETGEGPLSATRPPPRWA